jgi:hypothetical protein
LPICHRPEVSHLLPESKEPNQSLEPTSPSVTIRADARLAPAGAVAHL